MRAITAAVAVAVFIADFFLKRYLKANFSFQSLPVVKNIFHITVVFNKGAAFSVLQGQTQFLIYIAVIFVIGFVFFISKEKKKTTLFLFACGLILGGALSNLYDRVVFGYVVDYLDFRVWPVFNLSDSCITAGACLLFIDAFKKDRVGTRAA